MNYQSYNLQTTSLNTDQRSPMIDFIDSDHSTNLENTYYNSVCPPTHNDSNYSNAFFNYFGPRDLCATQEIGEQWRNPAENEFEKLLLDDNFASNPDGALRHNWNLKYIPGRGICTSTIVTLRKKKGTQLPPRYFETCEQSPQKRRIHTRTIGQRGGCFTFDSATSSSEGAHSRILKRKRVSACKSLFQSNDTKSTRVEEVTNSTVKVAQYRPDAMPTSNFQSPVHFKMADTNISPAREMKPYHGKEDQHFALKSKLLNWNFTWKKKKLTESTNLGNCLDLPPRYLNGKKNV
uniref:AlNc14C302G10384 protein n=1 Tax=Albugo laibachii Nc14 TaxID=890382 RepID=F0W1S1_9STRA|nr:AlNc14C7G1001 [Albugo laibachii Nc14]CCA25491.1 AlNc14C302G10384 [Albugo laibachii Nc14]|eukprot:CCA25491.1 AlNc14C302G10384 [Albugo laibachii Nc14]